MTQRLTTPQVRELLALRGIRNDAQLMDDTPFIAFRKRDVKRYVTPAWQVMLAGRRTDPDGHYRDGFNKTFELLGDVTREFKNTRLTEAQEWMRREYGITEWNKTPFGSWTDRDRLAWRLSVALPEFFDSGHRDPVVKGIVEKLYSDEPDSFAERMFRVVVQLYVQPEPPLYVRAADADAARQQVTQLFTRLAGARVLDGLRINVYDA
jgi:hypothetical protein